MPYNVIVEANRIPGRFAFQSLPRFTICNCGQSALHVWTYVPLFASTTAAAHGWRFAMATKKCIGCGKPKYQWSKSRRGTSPFYQYCSDKCKREHARKIAADRLPDYRLRCEVMKRDGYECRYCGEKAEQIDHVIPY